MKLTTLRSPFWITMLVSGVIFVAFFVIDINNRWNEIATLEDQLMGSAELPGRKEALEKYVNKGPDLPSRAWAKEYNDWVQLTEEENRKCVDYYRQADAKLEEWFPGLPLKNGLPDEGDFDTRYGSQTSSFINLLKEKEITIGDVPLRETSEMNYTQESHTLGFEPNLNNFKILQKRFWIQNKLKQAMVDSEVKQCVYIKFKKSKHGGIEKLPNNLGAYIYFKAHVYLSYDVLPKFVEHVLNPGPDNIFVTLKGIDITRIPEEISRNPEKESKTLYENEKGKWSPPPLEKPLVQLVLTGNVMDFEIKETPLPAPKKTGSKKG